MHHLLRDLALILIGHPSNKMYVGMQCSVMLSHSCHTHMMYDIKCFTKRNVKYLTIKSQGDCGVDNVFIKIIPKKSTC
jgi:hypothetical protein